MADKTQQTARVMELLKRLNNSEKICIDALVEEAELNIYPKSLVLVLKLEKPTFIRKEEEAVFVEKY